MIEIYSKQDCPYCFKSKELLKNAGMSFVERKLNEDFTREILLDKFPNAKSYPVVVVDGFHIGGYTQLAEMVEGQDNRKLLNEEA